MSSSSYGPTSQGNNTTLSIPGNAYNVVIDVRGKPGASGGSDQNGNGGSGGKARKGRFTINDYIAVTLRSWKNTSGPDGGGSCTDTGGRSGGASEAGSGGTGGLQTGCSGGGGGGGGGAGVQVGSIWLIIAGGGGGGGGGSWDQSGNDGSNAGSFGGTATAIGPNGGGNGSSPPGDGGGGGGGGGGSSGGSGGSAGADQQSRSTGGGGGGSAYRSNLVSLISGTDAEHDGDSDVIISYDYKVAEIEYFRATPNPDSSSPYDVTLQWKIIDAPNGSASIDQSVGVVTLDSNGNSESSTTVSTGLSPSNEILTKTYTLTVTSADGTQLSQSITVAVVDGSISTTHSTFFSSGSISFSELRTNFKESSSGQITASELLRNTNVLDTNPIVPDATENADIGYSRTPNITGTTVTVSGQSYSVGGTSYPVQGKLWVPTNLIDNPIDLVVAYHGTITLDTSPGATTILDASNTNLTLLKGNEIGIDDKIIFSVAYPQDGITVAQNINVLTQAQLSTFEFGDNLPYARAALLWAKNNLNSYLSSIGLSQRTNNVYMFGHSQGGSLVHKLNTLETTDGAVVNAPGPIRLDVTCENQENLGLVGPGRTLNPTNVTCQKLFNAYGSAATASEYQDVSLLYDYVTGHKATITYLQALDDPTGGTSGVGQVYWMGELTAAMSANGQSYNYITVPTGGHDAFYKPQNTTLHRAIRGVVGGYGVNLSISQFRNSIKYYNLKQVGGVIDLDIDSQNWNSNLNRNIVKEFELSGNCDSSDTYYYVSPHTAAAKFDNTSTYNLTILVSGSVKGSDGMNPIARSQNALSRTGSKLVTPNGNGGNAMEVDTTNGSIDINVSGSIIRGNKFKFGNFTDGAAITGTNYDVTILSGGSITGTFNAT